ncbi:TetR/AcrR family transcriptional regulator [Streptoalloteichus hindustanus]|uniref:Transcriptional regulator, TetR family n=1 Tax=Streptoalloteichus hindustanus TaxID=2017 RepID=A0A1M4XRG0_STRHI|nr:TetR/AcrR family transcriptional regulator [Streptoalloteichus hindustanus]SHE96035.1 transcriptional regulator, TetR family [Streptoalloteichus hindustanus]
MAAVGARHAGTGHGGTGHAGAGLRELRKRQTRQAISDSATRLFLKHGFAEVTIADVAAAAGVAKMTVTNYFPRKEDLALDAYEEVVDRPARVVSERPAGESALAALRRAYLAGVAERDPVLGFCGPAFARMIVDSPALLARLREIHEQQEDALAAALADEVDGDDDLTVRAAAALIGSVHRVLFHETLRRILAGEAHERVADAITASAVRAFGLVEPSLGRLGRKGRGADREARRP